MGSILGMNICCEEGEGSDGQGRMAKRDLNSYDYGNYKILIDSVILTCW